MFAMAPDAIEVLIHPQSVIHSMVQFVDHSVVAQLGTPDMRGPIAYGLAWPRRHVSGASAIDFATLSALTFEPLSTPGHAERFAGLQLAWQVLRAPSGTSAVLNAANEVAVAAFLDGKIRFDQIHAVNLEALARYLPPKPTTLADLLAIDHQARALAQAYADSLQA